MWLITRSNTSATSKEDLANLIKEVEASEAELEDIYYHIRETERLSLAKTEAIRSGNMDEYRKLQSEHDRLRQNYKYKYEE